MSEAVEQHDTTAVGADPAGSQSPWTQEARFIILLSRIEHTTGHMASIASSVALLTERTGKPLPPFPRVPRGGGSPSFGSFAVRARDSGRAQAGSRGAPNSGGGGASRWGASRGRPRSMSPRGAPQRSPTPPHTSRYMRSMSPEHAPAGPSQSVFATADNHNLARHLQGARDVPASVPKSLARLVETHRDRLQKAIGHKMDRSERGATGGRGDRTGGRVTMPDLQEILVRLSLRVDYTMLAELFNSIDAKGDGFIDRTEFEGFFSINHRRPHRHDDSRQRSSARSPTSSSRMKSSTSKSTGKRRPRGRASERKPPPGDIPRRALWQKDSNSAVDSVDSVDRVGNADNATGHADNAGNADNATGHADNAERALLPAAVPFPDLLDDGPTRATRVSPSAAPSSLPVQGRGQGSRGAGPEGTGVLPTSGLGGIPDGADPHDPHALLQQIKSLRHELLTNWGALGSDAPLIQSTA
jgi:hypothetical protein